MALVIVSMVILSTIGMAVVYMFGMDSVAANNKVDQARALYLAESGRAVAEVWLTNLGNFPELVNGNFNEFTPGFSPLTCSPMSGVVNVTITPNPNPQNDVNISSPAASVCGSYLIKSEGRVNRSLFHIKKTLVSRVTITTHTWTAAQQWYYNYRSSKLLWDEWPTQRVLN